jgi:S-DNA-T family DNA segregation ATPase FtsK/SpoIIIE
MATVVVRRQARRPAPEMPSGELILEAPRQWTQALATLPMLLIMAAMLLLFSGSIAGPLRLAVYGLFGLAVVGMVVFSFVNNAGSTRREMAHARRLYLRRLTQHRIRLTRAVGAQRTALTYLHPEPESLWSLAASYRLWERRADDADFAVVRVGVGPQSPAIALIPPQTKPLEQLEPLSALALRRFVRTYDAIGELPLALPLTGFARLHLRGGRDVTVPLVRAMLAQLATLHTPDDVRIAVCTGEPSTWDWVKWLPHALHPERTDALGRLRLVARDITAVEGMLDELLATRPRFDPDFRRTDGAQLVVVMDGGDPAGSEHLLTDGGIEGVMVIELNGPLPRTLNRSTLLLDVAADRALSATTVEGSTVLGRADALDAVRAEALARQLTPLTLNGADDAFATDLGLAQLLGIGDPRRLDPARTWVPRPARDRLRALFGVRQDGSGVELDLKESAQDGMGPHGLLIGATGSGKSELLRTLVLSLAVTHPPNALNFVLVDFKGGATFTRLEELPHTSAVITNLNENLPLVNRMADALNGELMRRQELLRAAGNFSSLRDYERARAAGAPLPEVPTLLVICDEFSELLSAKPDFIDIFVQIGRIGRALGVHLLLASQRLEEGRLRGLDTHLSFRIGLRTFSAMDSRTVLGVTDAFELPRAPGHGFLKYGAEPLVRFRSVYVSAPDRGAERDPAADEDNGGALLEYTTHYLPPATVAAPEPAEESTGESLLDIIVDQLTGRGTPAHRVWLPELDRPPTLDGLLGTVVRHPRRGLVSARADLAGALRAVVGIVDRPFEQRRDPLEFDLAASAGHLLITGGPRSGKSTALSTAVLSLALTHTPREAQFYCLDLGDGRLAALRGLPHVGGVAGRQNAGAVRRTVAQVVGVLAERERRFAEHHVDGIAAYRTARAEGAHADDPYGDVFLVVDGWQSLRKDFESLEPIVADLAARGLAYGVHVLAATARPFDLRPAQRDLFGSRTELRLGDPIDSGIDRTAATRVPERAPGRGIATSKHQMLLAVPRIDGVGSDTGLAAATAALVGGIAAAWPLDGAPPVRLLPATVPYPRLPTVDDAMRLHVGLAEDDLAPVALDLGTDPHVLLLGEPRAGKTAFLRLLARRIVDSHPPERARIVIIDHRRGLLGEITTPHLLGHGTDIDSTRRLLTEAARGMAERAPGPDVTAEALRNRTWWRGPELFVLVDDYDLVVSGPQAHPFQPLLEHLAHGGDRGLHVIVTRRTGGAARALFEPFLGRMRDVGTHGLLLAGERDEGPLIGGLRPQALPPGRGHLVTRGQPARLLQLAWTPPAG